MWRLKFRRGPIIKEIIWMKWEFPYDPKNEYQSKNRYVRD